MPGKVKSNTCVTFNMPFAEGLLFQQSETELIEGSENAEQSGNNCNGYCLSLQNLSGTASSYPREE